MLGVLFDAIAVIVLDAVDRFGWWLANERLPWVQAFVGVGCSLLALFTGLGVWLLVMALA